MKLLRFYTLLQILLSAIISCAPQREGFVASKFHNTTAHYNAYFLAKEKILEIENSIKTGYKWNYNKILPVLVPFDSVKSSSFTSQTQYCLEKASLIIERHPKSKWVDDAYNLVGKARIYSYDLTNAVETFKYVNTNSKDEGARHEALVSLMYTFILGSETRNAQAVSDYLKKERLNRKNLESLYLMRAYFEQLNDDLKATVKNLELAYPLIKEKRKKGRVGFLIGQIHQELKNDGRAFIYYKKVLRSNPSYELSFHTKLNMAQSTTLTQTNDLKKIRKYFRKLLKDRKNEEYKDKIYYEMAHFEMKTGYLDQAIDYFDQSVRTSINNNRQKAYSYHELAKIYYDSLEEYEISSAYYDSTINTMPKDEEGFEAIERKQKILKEFVTHISVVKKNDSLIALSNMDEGVLYALIDKKIEKDIAREEKVKKEKRKQKRLESVAQFSTNQTDEFVAFGSDNESAGEWYFYNPARVASGKQEFLRKWENRKLEDHWRRSTKLLEVASQDIIDEGSSSDVQNQLGESLTDEKSKNGDTTQTQELTLDNRRDEYLKEVPFSDDDKAVLIAEMEEPLYNLGFIYHFDLEEDENSIKAFDRLINQYDSSEYRPEAYYQVYLIYKAKDNDKMATKYADQLKMLYPDNDFAKLIDNPNYLEENERELARLRREYNKAYRLYQDGKYKLARQIIDSAIISSPLENDFLDNLSFLPVMITAKTEPGYEYQFQLSRFLYNFPETELKDYASTLRKNVESFQEELYSSSKGKFSRSTSKQYFFAVQGSLESLGDSLSTLIADSQLEMGQVLIKKDTALILIKPFETAEAASTFGSKFQSSSQNSFVISEKNFAELYSTKSLEEYLMFYSRFYQ